MIWGAGVKGARRSDRLIHLADLFPTLATFAGVEEDRMQNADRPLDGVTFRPEVDGSSSNAPARAFSFFERGNDALLPFAFGAVDEAGWKLILRETERQTNYSAGHLIEVYDTENDALEARNLFETPCTLPEARVMALFEFIASKAAENHAHSDWFEEEFYSVKLQQALQSCVSQSD